MNPDSSPAESSSPSSSENLLRHGDALSLTRLAAQHKPLAIICALPSDAQRLLAEDAVNGFLFQLPKITVQRKGLKGTWKNAPIFVNDLAAMSWN